MTAFRSDEISASGQDLPVRAPKSGDPIPAAPIAARVTGGVFAVSLAGAPHVSKGRPEGAPIHGAAHAVPGTRW